MADTSAMADIRGIDIDKLAKGFADEALIIKNFVTVSKTSAREIRWYSKTAGFLDTVDTSGITKSKIKTAHKARPFVIEPSYTRTTSYAIKYMAESPWLSEEDIADSDPDVLGNMIRDITRAVQRQVEARIYTTITEGDSASNIQSISITHEWDDTTNGAPITDLLTAREYLRNYNYEPDGAIFLCRPDVLRFLTDYLISVKGSSIPDFASSKVESGVVTQILGFKVVDSTLVTSDYAVIFVPKVACTWKEFKPITAVTISDPGVGRKVRVWEMGEALLTDPKAVVLFDNIGPS